MKNNFILFRRLASLLFLFLSVSSVMAAFIHTVSKSDALNIAKNQISGDKESMDYYYVLNVVLTSTSGKNMSLRLTPVTGLGESLDYVLEEGETNFSIPVARLDAGTYVLGLLEDNRIVDTRRITKE